MSEISGTESPIPGLFTINQVVRRDSRGWFKENFQFEKLRAAGLPTLDVVQHNISYNIEKGVTRGLHAEPWEKYVTVSTGRVLGVWVDLRRGPGFGRVFTEELGPEVAVFVPRGVANGYQTLAPGVLYSYLVNAHWSAEKSYASVNIFDPVLGIDWPIAQEQAIVSDKDRALPMLKDVVPMEFI